MIDDSVLFHAGIYDPVKARAYYLANRKLKGRRPSTATQDTPGRGGRRSSNLPARTSGGKPNRADTKSRQAELHAQKVALEKRLDHLRVVLQKLVAEAKGRSGVKQPKKDAPGTAPETKADKAARNNDQKGKTSLTSKQKADKAQQAKKAYEKEHPTSLSTDVEVLQQQVKDIQAKIQKAVADARERRNKAGKDSQGSGSQSRNKPNDGPRGR